MKGVIVGGGTFLGYWMKTKILGNGMPRPIIVDLPRMNTRVYKSSTDVFYPLQEIDYDSILDYRPEYILFNYYDLLDIGSLEINKADNNIIMAATNQLLDIAQELNCHISVFTHINRYPTSNDAYRTTFNSLNDLYLQYIELISRAKDLKTKIMLLPNLFGPRESPNGVIPAIVRNINSGTELKLTKTTRDFLYVDSVVDYSYNILFSEDPKPRTQRFYYSFTSGQETSLVEMYYIICDVLRNNTRMSLVNESYSLKAADIQNSKVTEIVIPQKFSMLIEQYVNL